jgi:hypothetical protein
MEKRSILKAKEVLQLAETGEPELVQAASELEKLIQEYEKLLKQPMTNDE